MPVPGGGGGGGAKEIRGITVFSYPSTLGGVRPEKNIPPLCVKKFRNPNFFLKNTTSCFFILCKRSLHNALRTPKEPKRAEFGQLRLQLQLQLLQNMKTNINFECSKIFF